MGQKSEVQEQTNFEACALRIKTSFHNLRRSALTGVKFLVNSHVSERGFLLRFDVVQKGLSLKLKARTYLTSTQHVVDGQSGV